MNSTKSVQLNQKDNFNGDPTTENLVASVFKHYFESPRSLKSMVLSEMDTDKGTIWMDSQTEPSLLLYVTKPIASISGSPDHPDVNLLLKQIPKHHLILPPFDNYSTWIDRLQKYYGFRLVKFPDKRFRFDYNSLTIDHLKTLNESLKSKNKYEHIRFEKLTKEMLEGMSEYLKRHFEPFGSTEKLVEEGFAFVAIDKENQIFSIAGTAHKPYKKEFEVQVVTEKTARGRGLGSIISTELLLYSLEHDYIPIWDAANIASKKMAEKLGYTYIGSYDVFLHTFVFVKLLLKSGLVSVVSVVVKAFRKVKKALFR